MSPLISNIKCTECNNYIMWGEFAYDQTMCWDCFEERVQRIARDTQTPEDAEIVRHLLSITKEIFRRSK